MSAARKEIQQEYYSTGQVGKLVGLSSQTIRREIKAGKLKADQFNGNIMIKRLEFDQWKAKYFKPYEQT